MWLFSDAIRFSFRAIMSGCGDRRRRGIRGAKKSNGIGESNRGLHTLTASCELHQIAQAAAVRDCQEQCKGKQFSHLVICNGWDCTPIRCSFGNMSLAIAPHARYLVKERANGRVVWRAADVATFKSLGHKALPKYGVVEWLAQATTCNHDCLAQKFEQQK